MKFSLGLLLALCLAGLQFVAVIIVVSTSYVTSERVLLDHARALLSDVGVNTIEHSKGFLNPAQGAAELAARLAENEIVSSADRALLDQLLFQQLQIAPQFAGVFYGDEAGNFVYVMRSGGPGPFRSKIVTRDGEARETELIWRDSDYRIVSRSDDPQDTYDPRGRPWYQKAKDQFTSIWTDPYIFFSSQEPGITIASPVIGTDGTLQGVIGVDIQIDAISDFLAQLEIGESGTALILNDNGDVIAHSHPELIRTANEDGTFRFASIKEIEDPVARAAIGGLYDLDATSVDQETYKEFTIDGASYVSMVMPVISGDLPWTTVIYAPEEDFIGAIVSNRTLNIWIAAAIALATAGIGLVIANYIHKPVRAFAVRSALVSQGEMDPATPLPKTYKELEHANDALMNEIKQRKKSEHEYGQTFELASRGMVQIAVDTGQFLRVNAKFADVLGYDPDELLSLSAADLSHPDDAMFLPRAIGGEGDEQAFNVEKRCIRKDGETIWVKVNAIMIRDDDGKPLHAVATIDDMTKAKNAEAQIQKLSRDLSQIARGELLGQMAAGLAHELNQPLAAIAQNTDVALMTARDQTPSDPELIEILSDIEQQAHRGGDIIKALRGFARKDEEWKKPFDLNELLQHSLQLVQPEATEHGISISVQSTNLPEVVGIRVQIAQVIVNLLRNAIESISVSGDNRKEITLIARDLGCCIEIVIEDSGPGVDPALDLFTQFETTKKSGMGLGLSICRSIIEAGGGKLEYDASFEDGARFYFTIPYVDAAVTTAAEKLAV